jgi:hypothetical protein
MHLHAISAPLPSSPRPSGILDLRPRLMRIGSRGVAPGGGLGVLTRVGSYENRTLLPFIHEIYDFRPLLCRQDMMLF